MQLNVSPVSCDTHPAVLYWPSPTKCRVWVHRLTNQLNALQKLVSSSDQNTEKLQKEQAAELASAVESSVTWQLIQA